MLDQMRTALEQHDEVLPWATDHDDHETAATIAVYAGFLGGWIELHEPATWAEELI